MYSDNACEGGANKASSENTSCRDTRQYIEGKGIIEDGSDKSNV